VNEIRLGSIITWKAADLTVRRGLVDFLHTDADGTVWAFCTGPDGIWAAVNTKYLTANDGAEKADEG